MAETITNDERIYQGALNEDRNDAEEESEIKTEQSSRPDFVTYFFLEGLIGLPGDLLNLIPFVGTVLSAPWWLAMVFIKYISGKGFKNPVEKLIKHGAAGWIPFSNTVFLTSCYIEETKLGKTILGKTSKITK
jgi:hypothetical protein